MSATELRATYRLQLTPEFAFADARALVPYLKRLGVSHLYLSPTLQARSGSTHGYDVVDPTRISEALGGEEGLRALAAELPVILDIVPNHMGTGEENRWWPDREVFDFEPGSDFYRRFFDIDDLAAVRQEDPAVFELTHRKVLELIGDGVVDGVRVDHPDGLADPAAYLERLRNAGAPGIWVEKILHPGEPLRDWPVDGTVGYEFAADAQAACVDPAAEEPLTGVWTELSGDGRDFGAVAHAAKLEQATTTFAREVGWLHRLAPQFDERTLAEALAALPVYRTYITRDLVTNDDRRALEPLPAELRDVLLAGDSEFVTRFQQTSPPVTAKGVEDTAFYRYLRLLALNEVGNDPGRFAISVEELHAANAARPARGLLVSTTHDTKRSADVRARIGALAEPGVRDAWVALARRWVPAAPDPVAGFLVLQTLLGAHPIEPLDRLDGYLEKALREAKLATSWVDQDHDYEQSVQRWARALLADDDFRRDLDGLLPRVLAAGRRSALAQLALKLTVPGVPDVYQGDEIEYHALVDPDNRRPVDFAARDHALADPPPKLKLIRDTLALRASRPEAFRGAYEPVAAPAGVCAFVRGGEVLVVVPLRDGVSGTVEAPGFDPVPADRIGIHPR
ncbi:MAG: (1-_4)-alpha-D-glucan 1-alpha-D-glucosylmutase [Solirubrobacteraceae bacterium]|nr:(1->4)-alpha-D-glucan 1-alpha-D-glucosylmutase [Solirubrobacteraceae bacterium]